MFVIRRPADPHAISSLRSEMDRLFESFFTPAGGMVEQKNGASAPWAPAIDLSETSDEVTIRAELPGIDAENVELSLHDDLLTISGQKSEEEQREGENHFVRERRFGAFSRTVRLPSNVDADNVDARASDGVLTITLRKLNADKPRRIAVRRADN